MSNTRFIKNSQNLALTATLKNGTGGGAPSTVEDSAYPMTNALQSDRYTPWLTPSGAATPIQFDIDLGSSLSVNAIGLHGFRLHSGSMGTLTITYGTSYAPGTSWGTISGATLTANRDVVVIAGPSSARYIRLSFAHTSAIFSVGKLLVAITPTLDAGGIYSPGSTETPFRYQTVIEGPSGQPAINDVGDQGNLWDMRFTQITTAAKDVLDQLGGEAYPFSLLDENDLLFEVMLAGASGVACERVFTDVWNVSVPLKRLP
jgi:hypothetical protein